MTTPDSLCEFRRMRRWLWTRRRWQEYTKALQDEVDSLRVHIDYQRTRCLVAVSFLSAEEYDLFREHVEGIDKLERDRVG